VVTAHRTTRATVRVAVAAALLAVSAKIALPTPWVSLTMQPLVVLLIGLTFPAGQALAATGAYLAIGLAGAPVFSTGGGPSYLARPTFGYLIGFVLAAFVMALLAGGGATLSVPRALLLSLVGIALIYAVGVAWLYVVLRHVMGLTEFRGAPITLRGAAVTGALLPLPLDLVKAAVASIVAPRLRRALASGR
jgi:biotin transport system substrate-specific component